MKRIGSVITFFVLVAALLLNGTSREFIHLFSGHEDTIDCVHTHNISDHHAAFEPEHHHCEFLQFGISIFDHSPADFRIDILPEFHLDFPEAIYFVSFRELQHTASRGPPAC